MQNIAIIGAGGQLGSELRRLLGNRAIPWRRAECDLLHPEAMRAVLQSTRPDAVINTAAYNWVDKAEQEPEMAYAVNALGPRQLAMFCGALQIPLVQISSDYVYGLDDTRQHPWLETEPPGPVSAYGQSKLAGEYFVRSVCPQSYVLRTCGLYGTAESAGKGNFVQTMLRLGREHGAVRVVADQHCTPTSVKSLAQAICDLLKTEAYGLYHATNSGATTWADFAREIFQAAQMSVTVTAITTAEYPTAARRPGYSVLNCEKLAKVLGYELAPWQAAVRNYVESCG